MPTQLRAFLLVGGIAALGLVGGAKIGQVAMAQGADPYQEIDTLAQALHHIESQYIEPIKTGELIFGAIEGMTEVLDKHSVFLDPDELESAQIRTEGVYSGVGIELKNIGGQITIFRVVPGSPADGKIERGETLVAVNGKTVPDLSAASEALRGEEGQTIALTLNGHERTRTVNLTRARIRDQTVRVSPLSNGWALAEISRFQRNTASDFNRGLRKHKPTQGVIIDLRGNGGGLLEEAVGVVNLFADAGLIVRTRGRDDTVLEEHYAQAPAPWKSLKLLLLVDGHSASASEIVAGSLRTLHNARLVGTETYGKWSVQRMYVFESKSAIKLTIAKYEIADEKASEMGKGLTPDSVVDRPNAHTIAIQALRKHLAGDDAALAHVDTLATAQSTSHSNPILLPLPERLTSDPQLKAAWTLALDNH